MKTAFAGLLMASAAGSLLCGCSTQEISRNVYEGVRLHNEALRSAPPDHSALRAPGFDDYDRERRRLAGPAAE